MNALQTMAAAIINASIKRKRIDVNVIQAIFWERITIRVMVSLRYTVLSISCFRTLKLCYLLKLS